MSDIKLCPFCGAEATIFKDGAYNAETGTDVKKTMWFIGCDECSAIICERTRAEAIKAWNRRTE